MSLIIVPLAGPDFYTETFGIRPLYPLENSTLLKHVLSNRAWFKPENQVVFVLRETGQPTETMQAYLSEHFPDAKTVLLDTLTLGAPLSALAGLSLLRDSQEPVIVDLVDIDFQWSFDVDLFFKEAQAEAILPYFEATDPKFSYLQLEGNMVLKTREKEVISSHASAGVYIFRNGATYLRAVAYAPEHPDVCRVGSALFVCPCVNGIIEAGQAVVAFPVDHVLPVSTRFHLDEAGTRF